VTTLTRRAFLKTVGNASAITAASTVLPRFAFAQQPEFTLKYGNNTLATHPTNIRAQEAAEAIKRETNGRVVLQVFPNGQMGGDSDMLSQVRSGAIDFTTQGGTVLSPIVPVAALNGIGFAFKDYKQVWAAMDGDLGKHIRQSLAKVGLIAMEKCWDNGFRHITSSDKPVTAPADLKGFKIRVPISPLWVSMFKAFGAAPTGINFSEVYSALQTKVVNGQENPLALINNSRMYEVQKYCSMTGHIWDGLWFIASGKTWSRLPKDLQDIVARHLNAAAVSQREDLAKLNVQLETELTAKGMAFNRPDITPFREALQKAGFYAEWHKKYGDEAWSLLEKYTSKLA
jgi:tripartite ATP-independent transporter DctP family solute receptor